VADVRGVPVAQVLKEFTETVRVYQQQLRATKEIEKGRVAAENSALALARLTDAVTNAATSVGKFETSMAVLSSVFSGQGGTGKVTGIASGFAAFGTGTGDEFRRSAGAVGGTLGPAGAQFLKSADASDRLARVLPDVLTKLGSNPLGPNENLSSKA